MDLIIYLLSLIAFVYTIAVLSSLFMLLFCIAVVIFLRVKFRYFSLIVRVATSYLLCCTNLSIHPFLRQRTVVCWQTSSGITFSRNTVDTSRYICAATKTYSSLTTNDFVVVEVVANSSPHSPPTDYRAPSIDC